MRSTTFSSKIVGRKCYDYVNHLLCLELYIYILYFHRRVRLGYLLILLSAATSLIEKVRRTVRGSADDIGWLQRDPDMPPVEDGTERFTEILDEIRYKLI